MPPEVQLADDVLAWCHLFAAGTLGGLTVLVVKWFVGRVWRRGDADAG